MPVTVKATLWQRYKNLGGTTLNYRTVSKQKLLTVLASDNFTNPDKIRRRKRKLERRAPPQESKSVLWSEYKNLGGNELKYQSSHKKHLKRAINKLQQREVTPLAGLSYLQAYDFLKNPIHGNKINLDDHTYLSSINFDFPENFLLVFNDKYCAKDAESLRIAMRKLEQPDITPDFTGSDAELYADVIIDRIPLELSWKDYSGTSNRSQSGYFQYYNNTEFDLSRYQIYSYGEELDNEDKMNCLLRSISLAMPSTLNSHFLKTFSDFDNFYIGVDKYKEICNTLNITLKISTLDAKGEYRLKTVKGKNSTVTLNVGNVDNHMFINELLYIDRNGYLTHENNTGCRKMTKSDITGIANHNAKEKQKHINSYDLVSFLYKNKEEYLTKIDLTNINKKDFNNSGIFDYKELVEGVNKVNCKPYDAKTPKLRLSDDYEIIYFDFETYPHHGEAIPYLINYEVWSQDRKLQREKTIIGPNCAFQFLEKAIKKDSILYAHNIRFDISFIVNYLYQLSHILSTGNKIKCMNAMFNKHKLFLKDSYSIIPEKLSKFQKMFGLSSGKEELMSYESYNQHTVTTGLIDIDTFVRKYVREQARKKNIVCPKEVKDKLMKPEENAKYFIGDKFKLLEYSAYYCRQDVKTEREGMHTIEDLFNKIDDENYTFTKPITVREMEDISTKKFKINLDYVISLSQLADLYLIKHGVFDGCYKCKGVPADFIRRTLAGGRTMTRDNETHHVQKLLADFDAVSLYPSAMARLDGFLMGVPKVIKNFRKEKYSGYFIEIEITAVNKHYSFPLLNYKNEEGIRVYDDKNMVGKRIYVDKYYLEDLIKFQKIEYKFIRGYYFDDGYNTNIKDVITRLFNERRKYKKVKNPIEKVIKGLMNSAYGKTILKPIIEDDVFVSNYDRVEKQKNDDLIWNYVGRNYNDVIKISKLGNGAIIRKKKPCHKHYSAPHIGASILSMSKRIMNEVMCLAEDIGAKIYYQDTDSMHIEYNKIVKVNDDKRKDKNYDDHYKYFENDKIAYMEEARKILQEKVQKSNNKEIYKKFETEMRKYDDSIGLEKNEKTSTMDQVFLEKDEDTIKEEKLTDLYKLNNELNKELIDKDTLTEYEKERLSLFRDNSEEDTQTIYLADEFKRIYNRELIGDDMGQFNSDFDEKTKVSVESLFISKKTYCDKLYDTETGTVSYHKRAKGIVSSLIDVPDPMYHIYKPLKNGMKVNFDMTAYCPFEMKSGLSIAARENKFERQLSK